MAVWLARAGKHGENESLAIDEGLVTVGWNELPDMSDIQSREELYELHDRSYPQSSSGKAANHVGQLWAFRSRFEIGDLVVLPLKTQSAIAIGRIKSGYRYRTDLGENVRHTRDVDWIRTDIPRTAIDQDLLHSLGAFMTVCRISRNDSERRLEAIAEGRKLSNEFSISTVDAESDETEITLNIEQAARDQISDFIQRRFAGHGLSDLVAEVLQAEGFLTEVSPPGPDGGVDILAGSGPMGLSSPRICVQVKSGTTPVDVTVLRGLQGILQGFQAEKGLLVSWGGFKSSVTKEAKQSFFNIRLWDSGDLLEAIFRNYDKLSDELQAELPLKRCWSLVLNENEEQ